MEVRKILGTSYPVANTNTLLYTVPAGNQTVVSRLFVCNQDPTNPDPIKIAICAVGVLPVSPANSEWVVFNYDLQSKETFILESLTMEENNTIVVYSKNGTSSFNAFGAEVS